MTEIQNGTDFILTFQIKDKDGLVIPYTQVDWEVCYFTSPKYMLKASCTNGVLSSGCEVDGDDVKVYVNNFNWGCLGQISRTA